MQLDSSVRYLPVQDFPGYLVGSDGSVWSCWKKQGRNPAIMTDEWVRLKLTRGTRGGYLQGCLSRRGVTKSFQIHVLVLTLFVGPKPSKRHQACHFPDKNIHNNSVTNLRWDTAKGNAADRIAHGTQVRGETQGSALLTDESVVMMRTKWRRQQSSIQDLSEEFGVCKTSVWNCLTRKTWAHIGDDDGSVRTR